MKILGPRSFFQAPLHIYIGAFMIAFVILHYTFPHAVPPHNEKHEGNEPQDSTPWTCNIPALISSTKSDPLWEASLAPTNYPSCLNDSSMFKILPLTSQLIKLQPTNYFWKISSCCYRHLWRVDQQPDFVPKLSSACYPIENSSTTIPPYMEFIRVTCTAKLNPSHVMYQDQFTHLHRQFQNWWGPDSNHNNSTSDELSVMIFGIQSMSRMHFWRKLPRTAEFLKRKLNAVEFLGFNSLGQGPSQNLYSLLSGLNFKDFFTLCGMDEERTFFDACPFAWRFMDGFYSSFQEEPLGTSVFSMGSPFLRNGFSTKPFVHDFRLLNFNIANLFLGHYGQPELHKGFCYGPRLSLENIITGFIQIARALENKKKFHFTWTKTIPFLPNADALLFEMLRELQESNALNHTALIFLSDNGLSPGISKPGARGALSQQEFLESRLPLLYVALPEWYRKKYREKARRLSTNSERLVHAGDVFKTTWSLMGQEGLEPADPKFEDLTQSVIRKNRSCESAGISNLYCACARRRELDVRGWEVRKVMGVLLEKFNGIFWGSQACGRLSLKEIVSAHGIFHGGKNSKGKDVEKFLLLFTTRHMIGSVLWEGTIVKEGVGEYSFEEVRMIRPDPMVRICPNDHHVYTFCPCKEIGR